MGQNETWRKGPRRWRAIPGRCGRQRWAAQVVLRPGSLRSARGTVGPFREVCYDDRGPPKGVGTCCREKNEVPPDFVAGIHAVTTVKWTRAITQRALLFYISPIIPKEQP